LPTVGKLHGFLQLVHPAERFGQDASRLGVARIAPNGNK
jgi:hypothetical protein